MTRVVTVVGAGGVGKTTIAAAVAVLFAANHKTLVITVDPAKRLATALGIADLGGEPQQTDLPNLWAAALEMESSWEEVARTHASAEVAERLIAHQFFSTLTRRFPASQSYAAADNMTTVATSGEWEVVVVDTPPASGGVEFFNAPSAMADLVNGRLVSALGGNRDQPSVLGRAAAPVVKLAEKVVGSDLLTELASFLRDLKTTSGGLIRRAEQIEAVFAESTLVIVTTFDPAALADARAFASTLPGAAPSPELLVLNRVLPKSWVDAGEQSKGSGPLEANLRRWGLEAARQVSLAVELERELDTRTTQVGLRPRSPSDLETLADLLPDGFEL
jgi:anion-transporting  ArsA/GET3 family ATPase